MPPFASDAAASSALTRRQFVTGFAAMGAALALPGLMTGCGAAASMTYTPIPVPADSASPLKQVAGDKSITYGAATGQSLLQSDAGFASAFAQHSALLVPENELKWETVEPQPNTFNFVPGDWLADFAARNSLAFRGHCLVWHQQIPSWAGNNAIAGGAQQQLASHISQTVQHYAGRMHSWDVVNEAINPADGRSDGLRKSVWLNALGPSYLELAFGTAAAADPAAVLVYNDYGVEYDTGDAAARRDAVLRLLSSLKAAGAPVHALGIQAHLTGGNPHFSATRLAAFLQSVADLGLRIFITELDVIDQSLPADITTRDGLVGDTYEQFLDVVLAQPAVDTVITWGLSDRYSWLSQFRPRFDGQPVRPLPLDSSFQPKPAVWAMMNCFNATAARLPHTGGAVLNISNR